MDESTRQNPENNTSLDTESLILSTQARTQQRVFCNDQERDNIKAMLSDPVVAAYFHYWVTDECRLLAVPPWFRQAYEAGEREKFIAPRDRERYGLSELTKEEYTKSVIDAKYN